MNFHSLEYLIWIAAVTAVYLLLPRRFQMPFVSASTFGFLAFYSPWSAIALVGLLTGSYATMARWRTRESVVLLIVATIATLLVGYKFALNAPGGLPYQEVVLIGASFYALRAIHYLVESHKGTFQAHGFADYLNYMLFLPVITIGPIHRFDEFLREQRRRRWDRANFAAGLERIVYGYVKVVFIAGYAVNFKLKLFIRALDADELWLRSYLQCVEYGLNLYFTFSGYSDIAIGFALLLGFRISENFRHPFFQPNISRFWKGWHISLSSWCRDYVYMPIAARYRRPILGIIASMLILGLWHELSGRYVAWGLYHGLGIVAWQQFQNVKPRWLSSLNGFQAHAVNGIAVFVTFNFVVLSFAITLSDDLMAALGIYRNLLFLGGGG